MLQLDILKTLMYWHNKGVRGLKIQDFDCANISDIKKELEELEYKFLIHIIIKDSIYLYYISKSGIEWLNND
jgi:hypothetical protein